MNKDMANKHLKESAFKAGSSGSNAGVAKPTMDGRGKAAPPNASNSAKPSNPGGLAVLNKIRSDGSFKTGHSK